MPAAPLESESEAEAETLTTRPGSLFDLCTASLAPRPLSSIRRSDDGQFSTIGPRAPQRSARTRATTRSRLAFRRAASASSHLGRVAAAGRWWPAWPPSPNARHVTLGSTAPGQGGGGGGRKANSRSGWPRVGAASDKQKLETTRRDGGFEGAVRERHRRPREKTFGADDANRSCGPRRRRRRRTRESQR